MMTLRGNQVVFDTKEPSGPVKKAVTLVEQYFGGIVQKLRESELHTSSHIVGVDSGCGHNHRKYEIGDTNRRKGFVAYQSDLKISTPITNTPNIFILQAN
jgi:hypothetical protein